VLWYNIDTPDWEKYEKAEKQKRKNKGEDQNENCSEPRVSGKQE